MKSFASRLVKNTALVLVLEKKHIKKTLSDHQLLLVMYNFHQPTCLQIVFLNKRMYFIVVSAYLLLFQGSSTGNDASENNAGGTERGVVETARNDASGNNASRTETRGVVETTVCPRRNETGDV